MNTFLNRAHGGQRGESLQELPYEEPDFRIQDSGTVLIFEPLSPSARKWLWDRTEIAPWQWIGHGAFFTEHRPAWELVDGILRAGFTVSYV